MSEEATSDQLQRKRLETKALVLGYAMSRLDARYLSALGYRTWQSAFQNAAAVLLEAPASFKNLRDEFDPVHSNPRRGWHQRSLRPNRQRVLNELQDVSDDALLELVGRILRRDEEATVEAIDSLAVVTKVAHNVAERLLTGRRAEEYFLTHCQELIQVAPANILDMRYSAMGFDFGVKGVQQQAIEVKGLKPLHGNIQFTDREWAEAKYRCDDYWLVIVGNLAAEPVARVLRNPHAVLAVRCSYQKSVTAIWRTNISVP